MLDIEWSAFCLLSGTGSPPFMVVVAGISYVTFMRTDVPDLLVPTCPHNLSYVTSALVLLAFILLFDVTYVQCSYFTIPYLSRLTYTASPPSPWTISLPSSLYCSVFFCPPPLCLPSPRLISSHVVWCYPMSDGVVTSLHSIIHIPLTPHFHRSLHLVTVYGAPGEYWYPHSSFILSSFIPIPHISPHYVCCDSCATFTYSTSLNFNFPH